MVGSISQGPGSVFATEIQRRDGLGVRSDAQILRAGDGLVQADTLLLTPNANPDAIDRNAVRAGLDLSLAAGRQALAVLAEIGDVAGRAAQPDVFPEVRAVQDQALKGLLTRLREGIESAIASGAKPLAGEAVDLGGGLLGPALDVRLGAANGAIALTTEASVSTQAGAQETAVAARESFARLSAGLARLEESAAAYDVHVNALTALDESVASRVQSSFDEDSARLLALQVRQTLAGLEQPVVNAGAGVLAHFRL